MLAKIKKVQFGKDTFIQNDKVTFSHGFLSIKMLLDTTTSGFTEPLCILKLSFQKSLSSRIQIFGGKYIDVKILCPF